MKKLLLSTLAITAIAFSSFAQNPDSYRENFDSTAVEPAPCFISWSSFTWQYSPGHDFTNMQWNESEKTMEMDLTTHASQHAPLFYQLSAGGTRAACGASAGQGQVDLSTDDVFEIKMKSSVPVQVIIYLQEGNSAVSDYSKFSNTVLDVAVTTAYQVFDVKSILDSNSDKSASIDLSKIGIVAFELGMTDGTNRDNVSGAKISIDYMQFGKAVVENSTAEVAVSSANVYPNPASDVVNVVVGSGNANVTLSDVTGAVVASGSGSGTVSISTANVPTGLYIVSVNSAAGVTTAKVVVK